MFDPLTLQPVAPDDPPVFHSANPTGRARALLVCDHASNALPRRWGTLGIAPEKMFEHIAWDVGAAAVTRELAALLDAPAIMAGFSRLYADPNRYPDDPTVVAPFSDGTRIRGNEGLSAADHAERLRWHSDYHAEVETMLSAFPVTPAPVILFIHSFTPRIGGKARPWHLGVLHDGNSAESHALLQVLRQNTDFVTGDNQPYSVDQPRSHSIFRHAIEADRPYVALEIRQDLIETVDRAGKWAATIAQAFRQALPPDTFPRQD